MNYRVSLTEFRGNKDIHIKYFETITFKCIVSLYTTHKRQSCETRSNSNNTMLHNSKQAIKSSTIE